ncbi:hypothetical protein Tco_0965226 [Tanacetum coccineum]
MGQPQKQANVHQYELCPPNKRYALMDVNKNIDFENPLCPNERKLLANILQNHPHRFSIVASSLIPWIYLGQFWHTLKEDGSNYRLKFVLNRKELTLTLDDFRTVFHLLQAIKNNHDHFVHAPKFSEMVPFYINNLGFTQELRSPFNFKTTGLIMQMLYYFVNNIHVDYADLLWEGLHYSLEHPSTLIPYLRFTKLIVSHYMTAFLEISRRVHDKYHNLEDDEMAKAYSIQGRIRPNHCELEAKQNVQQVEEHVIAEEIEKLVEGTENVDNAEVDSSTLRQNDNQNDPGTRLEPKSNKESLKVKINADVQHINVNKEEEESAEDDYKLRRKEKWKYVEESRNTPSPTIIRYSRIHSTLISSDTKKLQEVTVNDPPPSSSTPSSSSLKPKLSAS